jgi:hypothetical protein
MKRILPPPPEISDAFTLEDIRKIRDYDYELSKILTWEEMKEYTREKAEAVIKLVEERRVINAARARQVSASA